MLNEKRASIQFGIGLVFLLGSSIPFLLGSAWFGAEIVLAGLVMMLLGVAERMKDTKAWRTLRIVAGFLAVVTLGLLVMAFVKN